ncbi:hypothetical protein [Sodalis-like endosymbiont of Proechinophthirus fluctus]
MAEMTGVSQSSVMKVVQKLGYKEFTALKLSLSMKHWSIARIPPLLYTGI